ncbi:MAG: hypothetical protein ACHQF3_04700 [Alphaproteobacteria bacterium]
MSKTEQKPTKKGTKISSADSIAKAGKGVELDEKALKRVSGGLKLDYKE